ncbi:carcinoembryonic antigen-related cell adhesion molecule 5-like [Pungitius pungitius]|uniref:carcinoembryonic antigen-related cell adhesion molecule 5-like n=1 Tax=Pungitius pungitius TaxID=134920 RepID=UPI002E106157
MEKEMIHLIILMAMSGLTKAAGVLPDGPLNVAVGETVMFNTTLTPPQTPFLTVRWEFGEKNIFYYNVNDGSITDPEYEGRITIFIPTASLELRNVTPKDSGQYRVTIVQGDGQILDGITKLDVHVPVSGVTATASSRDLVEDTSVLLSCSSSGSSLSFLWLNGSSELTAGDRVQLTDGGATVTINVTRYDQGTFRCRVSNPVSEAMSVPINLSISFGPEDISLTTSPSRDHYDEGSEIKLMCSVESRPAAQLTWFLNGDMMPGTGPELSLVNVKESQSGNYHCEAFNMKTKRRIQSQPAAISVLIPVSGVTATASSRDLVEDTSVLLSCSSSGSSLSFLWLNGSSELTAGDRVQLTDGGANVTINVTRYDQGTFWCRVSNPVSEAMSVPINLSISFGPEDISFTISPSRDHYDEGSEIKLMCSAESRPAAQLTWFLIGVMVTGTEPELSLVNVKESQSGNYHCGAFNMKTNTSIQSQPAAITVLKRISGASITWGPNLSIEGNSFNLSCDAAGSVFTREWKKDGVKLTPDDHLSLQENNRVLSINSLSRKDTGVYLCNVINPVSQEEAEYRMVVFYGPENVQIHGPSDISLKTTLTLTCSAESVPALYTWMLNSTKIHNSAVYTKINTEPSDSGFYTCEVMNNKLQSKDMQDWLISDLQACECESEGLSVSMSALLCTGNQSWVFPVSW